MLELELIQQVEQALGMEVPIKSKALPMLGEETLLMI